MNIVFGINYWCSFLQHLSAIVQEIQKIGLKYIFKEKL